MRGVTDEDCGVARGKTSRCLRLMWSFMLTRCWLRSSSCVSALHWWVVFNLMINRQSEYNPGQGVLEAVRTSLRAVRGPALAHWHPGERRERRGAGWRKEEKLSCHPVYFQHSPKAQTKKIIAESGKPCLSRNEKVVHICPFCFLIRSSSFT